MIKLLVSSIINFKLTGFWGKLQKFVLSLKPATEQELAELIVFKRTVALMKKREPDTKWLLVLVGMWMPNDEIFTKSFKWQRPK